MKVALLHDYIKEYGGAERVLEALHELFPEAPIYTAVYVPEFLGPHKKKFEKMDIRPSWINILPLRHKLISPLRLISPLLFRSFDFSEYDIIISSATGAYFPTTLRKEYKASTRSSLSQKNNFSLSKATKGAESKGRKPFLICYCHTPPRYLYGYATARDWKKNKVMNVVGEVMNHFLRVVDYKGSQNVDQYIANSEEVAARIRKFYRKDAVVVYPPVSVDLSFPRKRESRKEWIPDQVGDDRKREYYLTGGRLARAKHNEIPLKACLALTVPLKVFGKGFAGYENELKLLAGSNPLVEFVGEVTDEEKIKLMAGAKAFLYASEDEDFGIIPVEAMSAGAPVIAYNSGGVRETVIDGKTGVFYDELSVESMKDAIKKFEKMTLKEEDCRKQAKKFGEERFKEEIRAIVQKSSS